MKAIAGKGWRGLGQLAGLLALSMVGLAFLSSPSWAKDPVIKAVAGKNGTIAPTGAVSVALGGTTEFTITPNHGYDIRYVKVNGRNQGAITTYTFTNVTKNVRIAAAFAPHIYAITVQASGGYRVAPAVTAAPFGRLIKFKVIPPKNGAAPVVLIDGVPVTATRAGKAYRFSLLVTGTHGISVGPSLGPSVTVTELGTGSGTVTSADGKLICPRTCTATYDADSQVTLSATATATNGSTFAGWSGAGCSGVQDCVITIADAAAVTATFNLPTSASGGYTLAITKAGSGAGDVVSSDGKIGCGDNCSANYDPNTQVMLTATPAAGSTFGGWSGACSGTAECTVSLDAVKFVEANFDSDNVSAPVFEAFAGGTPATGFAPLSVDFTASALDPNGNAIVFRAWDWDGDGVYDSCDPDNPAANPPCDNDPTAKNHVYSNIGHYAATVLFQNALGERATATVAVQVNGKSAEAKIAEAETAGTIDSSTALGYRVFAAFGDSRLPAQYQGDAGTEGPHLALSELTGNFDNLPDAQKTALAPFMLPPAYTGSWYAPPTPGVAPAFNTPAANAGSGYVPQAAPGRPVCTTLENGWDHYDSTAANLRVHWDNTHYAYHSGLAAWVRDELGGVIWPKLTGLMGGPPISDADRSDGCNGGNDFFDVYIVENLGSGGITNADTNIFGRQKCSPTSSFILLRASSLMPGVQHRGGLVAHEFMHALQLRYKLNGACSPLDHKYAWWADATAEWAKDFVYNSPLGDPGGEQSSAEIFLGSTEKPLDFDDDKQEAGRRYGAYLFPFALSHTIGPSAVPGSWAAMEKFSEPLDAIDDTIGTFRTFWPFFARWNWNRDPADQYTKWDKLPHKAAMKGDIDVDLQGMPDATIPFPEDMEHLSSVYYHFTFSDPNVRYVAFYNGLGAKLSSQTVAGIGRSVYFEDITDADKKGVSVQALLKVKGKWMPAQDVSAYPMIGFCRDAAKERVEEMVLIFANWDKDKTRTLKALGNQSALFVSNTSCYEWVGNVTIEDSSSVANGVPEKTTWSNLVVTRGTPGPFDNMQAQASPVAAGPMPLPMSVVYKATGGTVAWSLNGQSGRCSYNGQASGLAPGTFPYTSLMTFNGILPTGGGYYRGYNFLGGWPIAPTSTVKYEECCTDSNGVRTCKNIDRPLPGFAFTTIADSNIKFDATGATLSGTHVNGTVTTKWNFVSRPQP